MDDQPCPFCHGPGEGEAARMESREQHALEYLAVMREKLHEARDAIRAHMSAQAGADKVLTLMLMIRAARPVMPHAIRPLAEFTPTPLPQEKPDDAP